MRITDNLNNIYPVNNSGDTIEKNYQPEVEFKCIAEKPFKLAVEELLSED